MHDDFCFWTEGPRGTAGFVARLFARLTLALVVSGCGSGSLVAPEPSYYGGSETFAGPLAHYYGNDWMYVSQPSGNEVVVYKRKKNGYSLTPYETLGSEFSSPMGMVTTPDGSWYVTNSGSSNIPVYRTTRKGPRGPTATLSDSGEIPVNVAATADRELVAVSNLSSTASGAGSVSVYLDKQDAPSRILTYGSDPIQGAGVAIDSSGNCYWSFNDPKTLTGSIVEFASCSGNGKSVQSGLLAAGGMTFDRSGNLYYVDELVGIFKCNGVSSCGLFVSLGGLLGLILPKNINFDHSSPQNLWVADAGGYIDAVNLQGVIVYVLQALGGILDPPAGIAPAPGG